MPSRMLGIKSPASLSHVHFKLMVIVLAFASFYGEEALAVEIKRLTVPRFVQNGTEENVVLDCEYVYNENDFRLVVKWFFNDDPEPIYQWIPELKVRHVAAFLKRHLDMQYSANPIDPYSRYRALRFKRPTTEMSGKYTCLVTSLAGQDSREQEMIVYAPPKKFEFNYMLLNSNDYNFSCEAEGLYPLPQMRLLMTSSGQSAPSVVNGVSSATESNMDSAYSIQLHRSFQMSELKRLGATVFECVLEVSGTNYVSKRRLVYYPDPSDAVYSSGSSFRTFTSLVIHLVILAVYASS